MAKATRGYENNVAMYRPALGRLDDVLITPAELCSHWRYTGTHLCHLRRSGLGPAYLKLPTGGIRYRTSAILAEEIAGTYGPLTVERVCLALAACEALSLEERAIAIGYLAKHC